MMKFRYVFSADSFIEYAMLSLINKLSISLYCCLFFFVGIAYSAPANESPNKEFSILLNKIENERTYDDPTWLRLLHFRVTPRKAKYSDIISPEFFNAYDKAIHGKLKPKFATRGITAKQELISTLKAFYKPTPKDSNLHAQCRFPARFFWLNKKLNFKNKHLPKIQCSRLNKWAKFQSLDSVSLIMVSGYFGNPASTFGHLLVKLNNSEYKSSSGNLLDQSINYGAQVPQSEAMPIYVAKGIMGGYVSSFSDKKFYTQDLVYSKHEFRDMWEYELNLNKEQEYLMVYHLWEMVGMQSIYYFLKENCGYRIAELLELVTGHSLTPDRQPWYLPISVFQELDEVENSRYIKKITFIPSSQRKLYHDFDQLNDKEALMVNKILANPSLINGTSFDKFTSNRKSRMIEVMFDYYQYKLAADDINISEESKLKQYKNSLVLERLKLPIQRGEKKKSLPVPAMTSPAKGAKPRLFQVGFAHHKSQGNIVELGLTAVHYDLLSNSKGSLENSELKVFELELNYDKKQKLSLNNLTFISVQKLGLKNTKLLGERNLSWRVSTGFKKNNLSCEACTNFFVKGGIGHAYKLPNDFITYGILDTKYSAEQNSFNISPNIGLILTYGERIKSVLETGVDIEVKTGKRNEHLKLETRFSVTKNDAFRFSVEKNKGKEIKASYYHNW